MLDKLHTKTLVKNITKNIQKQKKQKISKKYRLSNWRDEQVQIPVRYTEGDLVLGQIKMINEKNIKINTVYNITKKLEINQWIKVYIFEIADRFIKTEQFSAMFDQGDIVVVSIKDSGTMEGTYKVPHTGAIIARCSNPNCRVLSAGKKCHNCGHLSMKKYTTYKFYTLDGKKYINIGTHNIKI